MKTALLAPISVIPKFDDRGRPINIVAEDGCALALDLVERFDFDEVDILSNSKNAPAFDDVNVTGFWDEDFWDFTPYDEVIVFTQSFLMFGGKVTKQQVKYVEALMKLDSYSLYVHDPLHFKGKTFMQAYYDRLIVSDTPYKYDINPRSYHTVPVERAVELEKQAKILTVFPNMKLPLNRELNATRELGFTDVIRNTFKKVRRQETSLSDFGHRYKKICYLGANRPERVKRLKELDAFDIIELNGSINNPFSQKKTRNIKTTDGNSWMREFEATLILADSGHTGAGINHRLLQGLYAECVCFIDSRIDPNRTLITCPTLREALYFTDGEDLRKKFTSVDYYDTIRLQADELRRIMSESVEDLIVRTTI